MKTNRTRIFHIGKLQIATLDGLGIPNSVGDSNLSFVKLISIIQQEI